VTVPARLLAAALGAAALAACTAGARRSHAPTTTFVSAPFRPAPGRPGFSTALRGLGRTHGAVAELHVRNDGAAGDARFVLPAGTVLLPGAEPWQAYALLDAVDAWLAAGQTRTLSLRGLCLDAARPPWPAGAWSPGARFVSDREWAAGGAGGEPSRDASRRLVAMRAATTSFETARSDPRWRTPSVPHAEEVVRQWAFWGATGQRGKRDLERTIEREAPHVPPPQRRRAADEVWAAASLVVETAGEAAAKEAEVDWAALDLTLK
jgi:hypothetical protein